MKQLHPAWLVELHRQWFAARGKRLDGKSRAFSRDWHRLLDDAGITSAEDVATAEREAGKLHDAGKIILARHRYRRHLIERLSLPVSSEAWLRDLFTTAAPEDLRQQSLAHVREASTRSHPRFPDTWREWLDSVGTAFEAGRHVRPLAWNRPGLVLQMLDLTFGLTARKWPEETLIREASVEMGHESKHLERSRRIAEACLASMFLRPTSLAALGILGSQPRIEIAGELVLHLPDGDALKIDGFKGCYHLTTDLLRAVKATTPAKRILTVENTKTTLRRIASLNADKETLILACAYPTQGLQRLIELLPSELPIHHFGDTDPAGFQILSKLRQAIAPRPVAPFLMHRRERSEPRPLTTYDRGILPALLVDPWLEDVRTQLESISASNDKGDFEQETLGRPELREWPFYRIHPAAELPAAGSRSPDRPGD
ncbi:DUF2220 domain-containing protein [Luteolibacter arcticus]|uniref:DUF2220 domain-containing protein n=1 Tax=Luteolibacter arcticus TaxID=1581411 RepID=A0ABT3GGQ5_9BACT|nr:DUF2220 domain-containing protein [Luteolibacter arcticus]MCW1922799.1 DUF2220 domain-containing protein [Luteolibacter arcticus]